MSDSVCACVCVCPCVFFFTVCLPLLLCREVYGGNCKNAFRVLKTTHAELCSVAFLNPNWLSAFRVKGERLAASVVFLRKVIQTL